MNLSLDTPPAVEPVSVSEAKAWARVEISDDDALITSLIESARMEAESYTGRAFVEQIWVLKLDLFLSEITLPVAPVLSVESVQYVDADGDTQAFTDYVVTQQNGMAVIKPAYDYEWPETRSQTDAVTITFNAGYGDAADDVPEAIKSAVMVRVNDLYMNREGSKSGSTFHNLLQPYRIYV